MLATEWNERLPDRRDPFAIVEAMKRHPLNSYGGKACQGPFHRTLRGGG